MYKVWAADPHCQVSMCGHCGLNFPRFVEIKKNLDRGECTPVRSLGQAPVLHPWLHESLSDLQVIYRLRKLTHPPPLPPGPGPRWTHMCSRCFVSGNWMWFFLERYKLGDCRLYVSSKCFISFNSFLYFLFIFIFVQCFDITFHRFSCLAA